MMRTQPTPLESVHRGQMSSVPIDGIPPRREPIVSDKHISTITTIVLSRNAQFIVRQNLIGPQHSRIDRDFVQGADEEAREIARTQTQRCRPVPGLDRKQGLQ